MMKHLIFSLALFGLFFTALSEVRAVDVTVTRIWDTAPHSAFTDLVLFKGELYCTFREGTGHIPGKKTGEGDGEIRIIKSKDGKSWESVALLKKKGYDLRDSKLSITPESRLMLTLGGSVYIDGVVKDRHPQVSFSDKDGKNFSAPEPIRIEESVRSDGDWLWRVTWHKGVGYGVVYRGSGNHSRVHTVGLLKTTDGIHYTSIVEFDFPRSDFPNEATVRFDNKGVMYILLRRENGRNGVFASSSAPYTEWNWKDTGKRLGGPDFLLMPSGKILIGSRAYDQGVATALYKLDENDKMVEIVRLPSKGDTSYPGLLVHDGKLWVSYYSGHEDKTSIYLATCPLAEIEALFK